MQPALQRCMDVLVDAVDEAARQTLLEPEPEPEAEPEPECMQPQDLEFEQPVNESKPPIKLQEQATTARIEDSPVAVSVLTSNEQGQEAPQQAHWCQADSDDGR